MSKHPPNLKAYAEAEERMLDYFSLPVANEVVVTADGTEQIVHGEQVRLDPAVDSVLDIISDNSEVIDLVSDGLIKSPKLRGFDDSEKAYKNDTIGPLIFGEHRRTMAETQLSNEAAADPNNAPHTPLALTPPKRARLSAEIVEIDDSPEAASASHPINAYRENYDSFLTNGDNAHIEHDIEIAQPSLEVELDDVVVYDDMVNDASNEEVTEEQSCDIIVSESEPDIRRTYVITENGNRAIYQLSPERAQALREQQQLNGSVYITEINEEDVHVDGLNVYLSDAALEQIDNQAEQQQLGNYEVASEEHLNNENANFVDDTPLEEERPDICSVFDEELEEHDDACNNDLEDNEEEESMLQLELKPIPIKQAALPEAQHKQTIDINTDVESLATTPAPIVTEQVIIEDSPVAAAPPEVQVQNVSARDHSSTTEFPVSSTSMPNGSDYDDYDDDLPDEQLSQPPRKYPPLLKNTLSADALDRNIANICQTQPQMSVAEKIEHWNISADCMAVEDVENFEAAFEQHDNVHKFHEFCESLTNVNVQPKNSQANNLASDSDAEEQLTSRRIELSATRVLKGPSESPLTKNQILCQSYKRLLQAVKDKKPVQQQQLQESEVVVVEDDDDDDCVEILPNNIELKQNTSTITLVPEQLEGLPENLPSVTRTTQQTQTQANNTTVSKPTESKETSTTDLERFMAKPSTAAVRTASAERQFANAVLDAMREQAQMRQEQQHAEEHVGNPALYYEQHEFCNYLGLTEMATANAVASAMRELANSTVARRSLRVRPKQQLDRMRSDARGRRRERQPQVHSAANICESNQELPRSSEEREVPRARSQTPGPQSPLPPPRRATDQNYEMQRREPFDYFYYAQGDRDNSHEETTNTMEMAFAQVYAAAAPAQSQLHERMQHCLKQARDTKPSIFIVSAMNHDKSTSDVGPRPSLADIASDSVNISISSLKQVKEVPEKRKKLLRRRIITASNSTLDISAQQKAKRIYVRNLVTRSTTHMNSKLLRNRKVNLLKSYELSDLQQARNKRLSGGSTSNKNARTPKVARDSVNKSSKKVTKSSTPANLSQKLVSVQREIRTTALDNEDLVEASDGKLPEQHRLRQQQQKGKALPSSSPRKSLTSKKKTATAATPKKVTSHSKGGASASAKTLARMELPKKKPKITDKKVMRKRAKSLPAPAVVSDTETETESEQMPAAPIITMQNYKYAPDMHEFIAIQSIMSPPAPCAASRRFMREARQSVEQQQTYFNSASYLNNVSDNSTSAALIYPPPGRHREPTTHPRETAGTADVSTFTTENTPPAILLRLTSGSSTLGNPLLTKHGKVLHMYYELEQLVVLQERIVTFWKYSKVFNFLQQQTNDVDESLQAVNNNKTDSENSFSTDSQQWVHLGRLRRATHDVEINAPFANRLCMHNSSPVYVEMRARPLEHHRRESKLLSMYVNIYYYCEEEMRPKMHSVHLDSVNSEPSSILFASIMESRYFMMGWHQENTMGKSRSGLCKYSLTPSLDTLASIREFKQMRHEIKYLECLTEDRLVGFGATRISIWDHRSGDNLMNYDLGFEMDYNLGTMHFPSFDIDQGSMLILYQHFKQQDKPSELRIIACELSHSSPSHRILHVHSLPSPQFDHDVLGINTGEHLILKSLNEDEIWISASDPRQLTYVAPQGTQRFYTRHKQQVIELSAKTLTVDSIANHMLKLATQQLMKLSH